MITLQTLKTAFSEDNIEQLKEICRENNFINLLIIPPQRNADPEVINMAYVIRKPAEDLSFSQRYDITMKLSLLLKQDYVEVHSYHGMVDLAVSDRTSTEEIIQRLQSGITIDTLDTNRNLSVQWEERLQKAPQASGTENSPQRAGKAGGYNPRFSMSAPPAKELSNVDKTSQQLEQLSLSPTGRVR